MMLPWSSPRIASAFAGAVVALASAQVAFADGGAVLGEDAATADEEALSWGWRAFAGVHDFSDESRLGDGEQSSIANTVVVGLRIYQELGTWASIEGELPIGVSTSRDDRATLFVSMPRVHGRLRPFGDTTFSPSLLFGAGTPVVTSTRQSSVPTDIQPALYGGLGIGLKLEGLKIGVDARYIAMRAEDGNAQAFDWEVLLTFGLRPKNKSRKPPPPPPDFDRDGNPDATDKCPERAEDKDGYEDEDGCPELDNDSDGVIDGLDQCQGEAETVNGYQDDDGCPDALTDDVRLVEGAIPGLRFDSGSGVMDDLGIEELDKLADLLKANPSIKIELYGHGDDREAEEPADRETIAQERADSVRQYLIEKGVGHGRIKAFSRGQSDPFADNNTASGRRANRRVEVQLDRDDDEDVN
ncbi:MAG: OmpA family protein [Myxococcales bacterium]|nr:OmpA family protein [Myxococcales bacterium]